MGSVGPGKGDGVEKKRKQNLQNITHCRFCNSEIFCSPIGPTAIISHIVEECDSFPMMNDLRIVGSKNFRNVLRAIVGEKKFRIAVDCEDLHGDWLTAKKKKEKEQDEEVEQKAKTDVKDAIRGGKLFRTME